MCSKSVHQFLINWCWFFVQFDRQCCRSGSGPSCKTFCQIGKKIWRELVSLCFGWHLCFPDCSNSMAAGWMVPPATAAALASVAAGAMVGVRLLCCSATGAAPTRYPFTPSRPTHRCSRSSAQRYVSTDWLSYCSASRWFSCLHSGTQLVFFAVNCLTLVKTYINDDKSNRET